MTALGGDFVREARRRAGLSQAALAERAGTTQSGIARWESGRTAISLDDVIRLIRLCGFDLDMMLVPDDDSDRWQASQLADLTAQQRIDRHTRLTRQLRELRRSGELTRGA